MGRKITYFCECCGKEIIDRSLRRTTKYCKTCKIDVQKELKSMYSSTFYNVRRLISGSILLSVNNFSEADANANRFTLPLR